MEKRERVGTLAENGKKVPLYERDTTLISIEFTKSPDFDEAAFREAVAPLLEGKGASVRVSGQIRLET